MALSSFREIIDRWASVVEFAHQMQVPYQRAYRWYYRDNIPHQYWARLLVILNALPDGVEVHDLYDLLRLAEGAP